MKGLVPPRWINYVSATLNGNAIELNVSKSSGINTATHEITSGFLASGSEHEVEVVWEILLAPNWQRQDLCGPICNGCFFLGDQ